MHKLEGRESVLVRVGSVYSRFIAQEWCLLQPTHRISTRLSASDYM
jgi:hypothetical protein